MATITGKYTDVATLETIWGGSSFVDLTAMASEFLCEAEAEVNKHLSQRYDISGAPFLTITTAPPVAANISKWLAIGYLYDATSRGSKEAHARADRYIKRAMANLKEIKEYKANLLDSDGALVSDNSVDLQISSSTEDYAPTFNEDDPLNWGTDATKILDIASERD